MLRVGLTASFHKRTTDTKSTCKLQKDLIDESNIWKLKRKKKLN